MIRKPFAFVILLLIAGLAPASAIIGFCTRMPCCGRAANAGGVALAADRADCCTTITCYDTPSAKLTNGTCSLMAILTTPALVALVPAPPAGPFAGCAFVDTSPPPTVRHRLAALSLLLI